jgi:hypothetical protein
VSKDWTFASFQFLQATESLPILTDYWSSFSEQFDHTSSGTAFPELKFIHALKCLHFGLIEVSF